MSMQDMRAVASFLEALPTETGMATNTQTDQ
jgi:hypothetical protein